MRRATRRLPAVALAVLTMVLFLPSSTAGAVAIGTIYSVGVDMSTPTGHNIAAVDFFPRGDASYPINIHSGDVLDFGWNVGQPDQLHTVTFAKDGDINRLYADNPLFGPDTDNGENDTLFKFPVPTYPPAGSGAPGACGDKTTPCVFDGSVDLSSGAQDTASGNHFMVQVNASPGTYNYACLIHPGMTGQVTVVPDADAASTKTAVADETKAQTDADVAEGLAAEKAANTPSSVTNADGTKTWTAVAGTAGAHTEVLEMLPFALPIKPGDKVNWKTPTIKDVHTVTFPYGSGSDSIDPIKPPVCEAAPTDTAAPGGPPPDFGCGTGKGELPFDLAAHGPTTISPQPYRTMAKDGGVFNFGTAGYYGSMGGKPLNQPIVGAASSSDGKGYWEAAADGGIFNFGSAPFFGSAGGIKLNKPVVGFTPTPHGDGYWEVASDGGIFNYGAAGFMGSMGGKPLNKPVVGIAATQSFDPPGYWEVASDGGIFSFGGADFFGSMGGKTLNSPIVGIAADPNGGGYWEVASDGGIFNFGSAGFFGSTGALKLNSPIVGMAPTPSGQGYWLLGADGGIFSYGDAQFYGSMGGTKLNQPMVGISALPATATTSGLIGPAAAGLKDTTADYTFTGKGVFTYQCRIHDHMIGAVVSS